MRSLTLWLIVLMTLSLASPALAADPPVDPGIEAACRDYIEGWFTGDAERMDRALHPELAKRAMRVDGETGEPSLIHLTKAMMVEYTGQGGGKDVPQDEWKIEITVFDVYRNAASAKVNSGLFVDYVHLVKWDGRWVILNVLWENHPRP